MIAYGRLQLFNVRNLLYDSWRYNIRDQNKSFVDADHSKSLPEMFCINLIGLYLRRDALIDPTEELTYEHGCQQRKKEL